MSGLLKVPIGLEPQIWSFEIGVIPKIEVNTLKNS